MTTPAPDLPDWTAGHQPITVPTPFALITIPGGDTEAGIDVSPYASVYIVMDGIASIGCEVTQQIQTGPNTFEDVGQAMLLGTPTVIPIVGDVLTIDNLNPTNPVHVNIWGLGRVAENVAGTVAGWQPEPYHGTIPSQAWAVNETTLFQAGSGINLSQGPQYIYCSITGGALTGLLVALQESGSVIVLADTGMFHASPTGGTGWGALVAFPANIAGLEFQAKNAVTAALSVYSAPNY